MYLGYDLNKDGSLQSYELALYLAVYSRPLYVGKPDAGLDWNTWAADAALFLVAVADADASGVCLYTYIHAYVCMCIYMYVCM
jgi:hypothetical protein